LRSNVRFATARHQAQSTTRGRIPLISTKKKRSPNGGCFLFYACS